MIVIVKDTYWQTNTNSMQSRESMIPVVSSILSRAAWPLIVVTLIKAHHMIKTMIMLCCSRFKHPLLHHHHHHPPTHTKLHYVFRSPFHFHPLANVIDSQKKKKQLFTTMQILLHCIALLTHLLHFEVVIALGDRMTKLMLHLQPQLLKLKWT